MAGVGPTKMTEAAALAALTTRIPTLDLLPDTPGQWRVGKLRRAA